jgi:hypothetical protein
MAKFHSVVQKSIFHIVITFRLSMPITAEKMFESTDNCCMSQGWRCNSDKFHHDILYFDSHSDNFIVETKVERFYQT